MTETLRDLMRERVADLGAPDLVGDSWARGRAVRRRRATGLVAGAAAATVAVVAGVSIVGGDVDPQPRGPVGTGPSPAATTAPETAAPLYDRTGPKPDDHLGDASVYVAPTPAEEAGLPAMKANRPSLPASIDLSTQARSAETDPLPHAEAAFAVVSGGTARVLLVEGDQYRSVDLTGIDPLPIISNPAAPPAVTDSMLSPGGDFLEFPQAGFVQVFDIAAGTWSRVDVGDTDTSEATWLNDTSIFLPSGPDRQGPSYDAATGMKDGAARLGEKTPGLPRGDELTPYGRSRDGAFGRAQSWEPGPGADNPFSSSLLVAPARSGPQVLLFTGTDDRCCPVASWSAEDQIVYESHRGEPRLVAWRVGTHDFETLSTLTGLARDDVWIGSYARWWLTYGR